jgi:hypothetical protein
VGIFQIRRNETAISFLSGRVPHLQTVVLAVFIDVFDAEIDSDRGLNERKSYMVSIFELIVGISLNDGSFSYTLISEKDDSELLGIAIAVG